MKQWEYMEYKNTANSSTAINGPLSPERLNQFGIEGWELVTITGYQYIFKREII